MFGRVFWRGGLSALLGSDEKRTPAMAEALADLERRELIQRQPLAKFPGQDEYAFRQPGEQRVILRVRPEKVAVEGG